LITKLPSACFTARQRIGQRERADGFARGDRRYVFVLLFLAAELQQAVAVERVVDAHDRRMRAIGSRDLDHRQHVADRVHPRPAVFGRDFDAHQAQLAHLADVVERKLAGLVEVGRHRRDAPVREVARDRLDLQLFFGKTEIHRHTSVLTVSRVPPCDVPRQSNIA
jgi:hypothetical protein